MSGTQRAARFNTESSAESALEFSVRAILAGLWTVTVVKVVAVQNNGGVSPVGLVDVLPLVNQVDGAGQPTPHITINQLPYFRLQGGSNAVILDPQVGDIGMACFASRDISAVKANRGQANPGSFRQHSASDGLYVGGFLNGTPTQYVQFTSSGITVVSPGTITLQAPTVAVQGNLTVSGTTTGQGDGTFASIDVAKHVHPGVQTGSGSTGTPTG